MQARPDARPAGPGPSKPKDARRENQVPDQLHQPVMPEQVIKFLNPQTGGKYVDLTLGLGGHARRILECSAPDGVLLGVDRDPEAIRRAKKTLEPFRKRLKIIHGRFSELDVHLNNIGWSQVDGMLADLGVSSLQLQDAQRGFSFQNAGPLDMRMDPGLDESLMTRLARMDEVALADVLKRFGEVRRARVIARRILRSIKEDPLMDTVELARIASEGRRKGRIHPATRVFMALRMMVNREQEELRALLDSLPDPLKPGGRVVFISFHSLEDRLVKQRLRDLEGICTCPPGLPKCCCGVRPLMRVITRRPVIPEQAELDRNPRARSARLRMAERLAA
ncbi:MAG: 16S rRNA (cytosine(1402)-N(4))-methyltransferase RsmH [Deltaproteobacteria bacterium]|nr:16S rRNA (cytosine(1402)-N(4))-methyltransferase RsmH [Deltaproteobacteria bacterium]